MKNFKEWLLTKDEALYENMWGNIPCKTRKPSDGWTSNGGPATVGPQQQGQPSGPQMMKKMKRKMKK